MTPSSAICRWVWLLLLFCLPLQQARAQLPLPLTLQPHKIRQARQLYRDGIARNDYTLIAEAYYVYGRAYFLVGDYLAAQRWFMKSLRIQERKGDSYELGRVYIRLGDNEMAQNHLQESLRYVHIALPIFQRIRSHRGLLRAYSLLAMIHSGRHPASAGKKNVPTPADSALTYFHLANDLAYKLNDSLEIAAVADHLGGLLSGRRNLRGIAYQQTALAIYTKKNVAGHQMYTMISLASSYLTFGRTKSARQLLVQAQQLYLTSHLNEYNMLQQLEGAWIYYYQTIGNWKQAFAHQGNLRALERRKAVADREGAMTRLNLEYETEKKEALLKTQREELALRSASLMSQQRFIWAMAALLLVTVGTSLIFFQLYRQNQQISKQNTDLVKEQNHRVKNNLQVVSSLLNLQANQLTDDAARKAVEESQLRVQSMATLQRRLYDGNQLVRVSLPDYMTELIDNVLETFGYTHLQPVYDIQPISMSADDALPLGLILNELTTNACKYAFPKQAEPIFRVSCQKNHKTITLRVSDNGPGYSPPFFASRSRTDHPTFGMRLIQMQVGQLRGAYWFTVAGGTLFTLEFNVS